MRLLLAEDEEDLQAALVAILRHNRYEVDAVGNGLDALDYLDTGVYDGAILDVMMPGMDGFTVLETIRRRGNKVPVLMLTARAEIDDRVRGLDSGADDYLTKPFAMKELLARIRALTRRAGEASSSVLTVGNTSLDRMTCLLRAPGGEIRLANKEYQMLEMLLANPGQVISGEQFMEKIWGFDTEVELNVVWVLISNLRRHLKKIESNLEIRAARGLGYHIEVTEG